VVRPALHGLDRERGVLGDVSVGIDDLHASLQRYSPGFGSTGLSSETLPPSAAPTVCC
jgi:hypothetical protein